MKETETDVGSMNEEKQTLICIVICIVLLLLETRGSDLIEIAVSDAAPLPCRHTPVHNHRSGGHLLLSPSTMQNDRSLWMLLLLRRRRCSAVVRGPVVRWRIPGGRLQQWHAGRRRSGGWPRNAPRHAGSHPSHPPERVH